jgi:NADPH-dependent 2,4-dienoyl-CoA reductase/sulfur reductase-like enzyme
MLLELRVSAREYMDGGITTEETIEFFQMLEAEHLADIFHITGGRHVEPRRNAFCISPATFPPALFRPEARKIRDAGIQTPLALINSLADPDIAEDVIASGDADFVVLSRQLNLADPYYPRKLREGKPWLIDNCLRCHGCYDVTGPCSVNPLASSKTYESSYELPLAKTPKKLCIVGGGIAGLKAAFTAAERGHKVILFEKEAELGGQLRFADTDTFKIDIRRYKNNMIRRCELHPNIEIRLNTEATPELLAKELPCALIVAVGASQKVPNIPGVEQENVIGVMDAYLHPERMGQHVLLVGSGLTACEVGLHLNRSGKQVTIVGRRDRICPHETMFNEPPSAVYTPVDTFLDWFDEHGIALYNNSDVIAVVPEGVRIRNNQTGEEQVIACDTVILAAGMTANRQQALQFNDVGASYFAMAGDCIKPKKIRDAVSTGYFAAMEV